MTASKTKATSAPVAEFLDAVPDPGRRADAKEFCRLLESWSGEAPAMWGASMVGFGRYRYRYESGREGEAMRIGFSPRAKEITLYIMGGFPREEEMMAALGKYRSGKACLYIKQLSDIDLAVLERLVRASLAYLQEKYSEEGTGG